ncbi:HAMP domain-containing histidine kinase [Corynebacterium sp. ES2794-CONJ1]|uniref:HAMP domain-containing sensor histidine kinase n=1 Tax=unclassified Corynebacterium TaxID=2624378 RepID=UPI002166F0A5|nr:MULTISPECIES: HAMP domain-containing sensor histidine kinase [unclassified Corynebacterium]MCS4490017.1 HAMP domain-containing histidine kinase [Corynebacterium sp. ES2775-CONJ]MCS4491621.1 HAMP domain-containing histidine kinase [Corynebacterium sp. ES2715-CONJ3]MCS4531725.1 HAMP domain-containing histidine kinase [Corynebacterium sp. ES2730-CONJ]MCU9519121.1 HAMP domain-containing histidine kinase [Corynebacterium sp. ES2794-CONJ1]
MILRRPSFGPAAPVGPAEDALLKDDLFGSSNSLRWRVTIFTTYMVAIVIFVVLILSYLSASRAITNAVDQDLRAKAESMMVLSESPQFALNARSEIDYFKVRNPDYFATVQRSDWVYSVGDELPLPVIRATDRSKVETIDGKRIYLLIDDQRTMVMIARDFGGVQSLLAALGFVLLIIAGLGIVLAVAIGLFVARAGLRPLVALQAAVEEVTKTKKLEPIPVSGTVELAQLTTSFNEMLRALEESRKQQAELIADAGHELKTPLTSMRTNIELLMMMEKQGGISASDRAEMESDVLAQMEELTTLIETLGDLAREDSSSLELQVVELADSVDEAFEKVRRRRPDIQFIANLSPWYLWGDLQGIDRAILNLIDNAAKFSPPGAPVKVNMEQLSSDLLELSVADSGPGIAPRERHKVFGRFYRSIEARAVPGSGLGLSIVAKVIARHHGTIEVLDSEDGGTLMRVTIPGSTDPDAVGGTQRR